MTDKYLEAHITVEPFTEEIQAKLGYTYDNFSIDAQKVGWKSSKFEHDDVDGIAGKWFMSARFDERIKACEDVSATCLTLVESGFKVLRWKIERTLYDSNLGDSLTQMEIEEGLRA